MVKRERERDEVSSESYIQRGIDGMEIEVGVTDISLIQQPGSQKFSVKKVSMGIGG